MSEFLPQSYLSNAGGLACYDLEFCSRTKPAGGYMFHNSSGLFLAIDVDAEGDPLSMTLVHKEGAVEYSVASSYEAFVEAAKEAYKFAQYMVALAQAGRQLKKKIAQQPTELEEAEQLKRKLFEAVKKAERFGEQRKAA